MPREPSREATESHRDATEEAQKRPSDDVSISTFGVKATKAKAKEEKKEKAEKKNNTREIPPTRPTVPQTPRGRGLLPRVSGTRQMAPP